MDNNQYETLMKHLRYIESLLENIPNAKTLFDKPPSPKEEYECPICKTKAASFATYSNRPNAQCPNCRSLERHRALWLVAEYLDWHKKGMKILDFVSEPVFYKLFSSLKDVDYWPVDMIQKKFRTEVRATIDITNIPFDSDSFDLIMCNYIMEFLPDDKKAMSEIHRVLKPKTGLAFLNVPIRGVPRTVENPEYNTPELRFKYYGNKDHMRHYALDYPERLAKAGFNVQSFAVKDMEDKIIKRYSLNKRDTTFLCRKG